MLRRIGILVFSFFPLLAVPGAAQASAPGIARNGPIIQHSINYAPA